MKRFLIIAAVLPFTACCGGPALVTDQDLRQHLESQGYSKVLLRDKFSCGKAGKGKHFIATKANKPLVGQICYLKTGSNVTYKVDELKGATVKPGSFNIRDPWNKK
jgi:hypothetical protein